MTALFLALAAFLTLTIILVIRRGTAPRKLDTAQRYYRSGHLRKSIAILQELVAENPDNLSARWLLANFLEKFGDWHGACELARPLLVLAPPDRSLTSVASETAPAGDDDTEPIHDTEVIDGFQVLSLMIRCLLAQPNGAEAMKLMHSYGDRYIPGITETAAINTGEPHEFSSDATIGIHAGTTVPPILKLYAETAEQCGESSTATAAWQALTRWRSLEPVESLALGRLLARNLHPDEALPHLERAHAAMPHAVDVARLLAETYAAVGRHVDAHRFFRQLYLDAEGRGRVTLGFKFAAALLDVGNVNGAVDVFEQIAELPEASRAEAADALVQAGDLHLKAENQPEAQKRWQRALDLFPDHPAACKRLGYVPRPQSSRELIDYIRHLSPDKFRKLFERILTDWGYTLVSVQEVDRDRLNVVVSRLENGKDRQKLVYVTRWENEVGQFPIQDLKLEVLDRKYDAGVFIAMSHYSANALMFANRAGFLELFSASELFPLIEHIELPR